MPKRFHLTLALFIVVSVAAVPNGVHAQVLSEEVSSPTETRWTYLKRFSQRPLVLQRGMIRGDGIFTVWDDGVDINTGLDIGGAVGVTDRLELGISNYRIGSSLQRKYESLISVAFSPDAGFGDIPVYSRYLFLRRDKAQMAADLILLIPSNTAFALETALPVRLKANEKLSIDTGAEVRGTFGSAKRADVRIPAIVNFNFSDRTFIAAETGVQFVNLGKNFDTRRPIVKVLPFLSVFASAARGKCKTKT